MSWSKKLITLLPDSWQDRILARVIASNRWNRVPTFHMLFESYVLLGADREDLLQVFVAASDLGASLYHHSRRVSRQREAIADQLSGSKARLDYQKALMLYFLADWVAFEEERVAENYHDLLRVSQKIDGLAERTTEKVIFPWSEGHIAARFRVPDASEPPAEGYPVVMLAQGNDTVKETLLYIEDELLDHGFAVLNVDQAGWGESRLSGNRYRSLDDARALADQCISFFDRNPLTDVTKAVVLGFSGGGTWAAMTAGTDSRFGWLVAIGGAIYNLDKSIRWLPAMQKRQVMKHWGCKESEIEGILRNMALNDLLPNITARCLLVHGEKDTLVPVATIHKAAELITGPVDVRIVPGGDHMCSATLKEKQIPEVVAWLRAEVGPEPQPQGHSSRIMRAP
jgi:pimeloyl-ACP methyl ester carboxylesterase